MDIITSTLGMPLPILIGIIALSINLVSVYLGLYAIYGLLTNIYRRWRIKTLNWQAIIKRFVYEFGYALLLFVATYIIYILTTGETKLLYIDNLLAIFGL
ncbi:hypothetical protein SAMN02745664_103153 [Moraxella cuniculi DSM 21768]|uniref:Uncharacterized protein n=1 Tax=Moraxella cuniculi DSM 21768 TaxID=1122245 RepID=A0A1N7E7P6_9GAMM|nr:hypothetical protein [Moraxella cuniculi]OOS06587.1 hypothetical protein B0189_04450 [Moraxella cuniculi]SIR84046.1 hypothetical protein SAMN02745664_103153 [Moraxella cuniculi DSM 21768]